MKPSHHWILAAALAGLSFAALADDCRLVRTSFDSAAVPRCGAAQATLPMPFHDTAAATQVPANLVQQVVVLVPASGAAVELPLPGLAGAQGPAIVKASPQATRRAPPQMTLSW